MPDKAHLSSVKALEVFRTRLVRYLEKATLVVDEAGGEARRMRVWLQERRKFWERQLRLRSRALEEARHEAFGARLSPFKQSSQARQMAVHRAKISLRQAEEKLRLARLWSRRYEGEAEALVREVEKLRTVLIQNIKKGSAGLERILRSLDGYWSGVRSAEISASLEEGKTAALAESSAGDVEADSERKA